MMHLDHHSHPLAQVPDSEILIIAVVAAKYFANHHERSVGILQQLGYLSGRISVSRFNRRLHALADWMAFMPQTLGALWTQGEVFVLDSLPVPVCRHVRARRCRKVRGRIYCGYCAAKQEKFFGWRLQLVCTTEGVPVSFVLLPGSLHDLTPVHELLFGLPQGAKALGDKAFTRMMKLRFRPTPGCAWCRFAKSIWSRTTGSMNWTWSTIAKESKRSTASWRAWASSGSIPAPIKGST